MGVYGVSILAICLCEVWCMGINKHFLCVCVCVFQVQQIDRVVEVVDEAVKGI